MLAYARRTIVKDLTSVTIATVNYQQRKKSRIYLTKDAEVLTITERINNVTSNASSLAFEMIPTNRARDIDAIVR